MTLVQRTTAFLSVVLFALGLAVQPALAQDDDAMDKRMTQLQSHMDDMSKDMKAIEGEEDPEKRRRMLRDHMESMHEAMAMMQKEMMPSMKRMHRHKQRPSASRRDDTKEYDSEEHMERMEDMMAQMESLMGQMSQHRRAMRDSQ
jgi:periplasmic protein CpxP/Spy